MGRSCHCRSAPRPLLVTIPAPDWAVRRPALLARCVASAASGDFQFALVRLARGKAERRGASSRPPVCDFDRIRPVRQWRKETRPERPQRTSNLLADDVPLLRHAGRPAIKALVGTNTMMSRAKT